MLNVKVLIKSALLGVLCGVIFGCAVGAPVWNSCVEPWSGIHCAETEKERAANLAAYRKSRKETALAIRDFKNSQASHEADYQRSRKQNSSCMIHFQNRRNESVSPSNVRIRQVSSGRNTFHDDLGSGNDPRFSVSEINVSKPLLITYELYGKKRQKSMHVGSGTQILKVVVD